MANKEQLNLSLKELRERQLEDALALAEDNDNDRQQIETWNKESDKDLKRESEISIAEEYRMLLEGRRVQSRRSQTQTVLEKERQNQLDMMKQQEKRKREKSQIKQRKQKAASILSKNDSDETESLQESAANVRQDQTVKSRRESKLKDKQQRSLKDKSQKLLRRSISKPIEKSKVFKSEFQSFNYKMYQGNDDVSQSQQARSKQFGNKSHVSQKEKQHDWQNINVNLQKDGRLKQDGLSGAESSEMSQSDGSSFDENNHSLRGHSEASNKFQKLEVLKPLRTLNTEVIGRENNHKQAHSLMHLFKEPILKLQLEDSQQENKTNFLVQNQSQTTILDNQVSAYLNQPTYQHPDIKEDQSPSQPISRHGKHPQSLTIATGLPKREHSKTIAKSRTSEKQDNLSNSPRKGVKDFQDQLRDFTLLDKILPNLAYIKGCIVQVHQNDQNEQKFAKVDHVSSDQKSAMVTYLGQNENQQVQISKLKYLARAYTCSVDELEQKSIPPELNEIIKQEDRTQTVERGQVVLIQLIYPMQSENSQVTNDLGPSVHRLNAIVPTSNSFNLQPVTFQQSKRQVQKKELKPTAETQSELDQLCYKDSNVARSLLQHAKMIQKAWRDNYLENTERVEVNALNIEDLLFTICSFSDRSERFDREQEREKEQGSSVPSFRATKVKVGILMSYRVDINQDQENVLAFLKLFPVKVNQKEKVDWVKLRKVQIIANESLGYVQLASLGCQETHQALNSELKLRQLKMISKSESQQERAIYLLKKSKKYGIAKEAQFFVSSKCKVETCKICKYQTNLDGVKFFNCSKCNENFHYKCLESHQRNIGNVEKSWRCPDCMRCGNCYSQKHQEQLLICIKCNSSVHYECLHSSYRNKIKTFPSDDISTIINMAEFVCECCIQCQNCQRRDAGDKKQNKWSKDFKYCSACNKKRDRKEYCSICENFWPAGHQHQIDQEQLIKCGLCQMWIHLDCDRMLDDKTIREKFISLEDFNDNQTQSLALVNAAKHSTLLYNCPNCRKIARSNFLEQIICIMMNEDKRKDFIEPFWEKMQHSDYLDLIKRPICFTMIKQDIRASKKYLMHPETFKADILRIFWNARTFNSITSDIHKAALRLNEKCSQILSQGRLWEIIETNGKASLDEERHSLFMRRKVKLQIQLKTSWKSMSTETPEQLAENQSTYLLKSKELFQHQEQINVRQFGVNITEIEKLLLQQAQDEKPSEHSTNFCQTLTCLVEPQVLFGLLEEANRRLISQNLNKRFEFADIAGNRVQTKQLYDQEMYTNLSLIGQSSISSQKHIAKTMVSFQKQSVTAQRDQWLQLTEELRNNEDRDGDWYSNPLKICFDDPALIFVEMCYLCGSFGNQEDFLSCNLCGESFHPYCLPDPKEDKSKYQEYWRCYNCIFCEKCHSSKQWEGLLICAVCDKVDHYWCLEPQLIQVPECNWKCPDCFQCSKCNTKQFFSEQDIEKRINLDPKEKFILSYDFEFCYQCGLNEYRKTFCNLCAEKSGIGLPVSGHNQQELSDSAKQFKIITSSNKKLCATPEKDCNEQGFYRCIGCNFYSHIECSRTNIATLEDIMKRTGANSPQEVYKCLDCLLLNKLPNYYMHQQCELYENIHQTLQKQAMIRTLCNDILAKYITAVDNVSRAVQADLYVNLFIEQNQNWLRNDSLINQWLLLLESDLDITPNDQDSESSTLVSNQQVFDSWPVQYTSSKPWQDFNMHEVLDIDDKPLIQTEQLKKDIFGHKQTFLPVQRNLYLHMYLQMNKCAQQDAFMRFNELSQYFELNQQVSVAEMFVNIEFRAVLKIRQRYSKWFESLLANTLQQSKLFLPDEEEVEMIDTTIAQPYFDDKVEAEQISTISTKPNLRERPQQVRKENPENEKTFIPVCVEEDLVIDNPQNRLTCVLCKQNGERTITGRLIPFQSNQFVHVNCALWSYEVQEGHEDGILCTEIYNFHFAYNAFKNRTCSICQLTGASLLCMQKKCNVAYHFPCAYKSFKVQMRETGTYCETCTPKRKENQPGYPLEFKNNHRQRFIIVKNIQPQCTDAFDDQVKKKAQTLADATKKDSHDAQDRKKEEKTDVIVQCNNWSPYYYDMFNRVGNLTVLSLSKRRNATVENLHTIKNKNNTWAERLNRKFPEKDFTDYAAVRIYWKYPDQAAYEKDLKNSKGFDLKKITGPCDKKGFYLFHDGNQVTEIQDNSYLTLLEHMSRRLKEHQSQDIKAMALSDQSVNQTLKATDFWEQQIQNLSRRYSKFCQENTYLTVQFIQGLEKFPIQYWNNPGEKLNLELKDLSVASFFFKSAFKTLDCAKKSVQKDQSSSQAIVSQPTDKQASSLDSIFLKMLQANQVRTEGELTSPFCAGLGLNIDDEDYQELSTKHMNYEQLMARLGKKTLKVKIKERREKEKAELQAEQASSQEKVENKSDSDHQIAGFLDDASELESEFGQRRSSKDLISLAEKKETTHRRKGGNKQTEIGELNNKGNDINQAMKYRASKLNPKHVEVWISKIHRNGLFACQQLQPKDIVIEYVGEKIRESVADQREKYYEELGVGDCYLFSLDKDYIIDATFFGSKARYINHSCDPNLVSEKITVNGEKHIIFVANRVIAAEEELTFDYQFDPENETNKLECFCGSENCRSRLN